MTRSIATTEPPAQACRALLGYIERETDARRRDLMMRDCRARAKLLPDAVRHEVEERLLAVFDPGPAGGQPATPGLIAATPRTAIDVLVVTVIPIELTAAKVAFELPAEKTTHDGRRYYRTAIPSAQADRDLSVVVTDIGRAGNVSAATAVSQMQLRYDPAVYFLVGIAGGLRNTLRLGDVVRPIQIIDYEGGVMLKGGKVLNRPDPRPVPEALIRNMNYHDPATERYYRRLDAAVNGLQEKLRPPKAERPKQFRPRFPDKVALITGEKVRRDGSLVTLNKHNDLIKAVDMESTGFARQVGAAPWAVFRGISDFADPKKEDNWHGFAALAACVALRDFLETEYEPPDVSQL